MKKRKPKKIYRKKMRSELNIDPEHQKHIDALVTQFKEDQLKKVLRRGYQDVQKYGAEAILKATQDSWTALMATACHGIADEEKLLRKSNKIVSTISVELLDDQQGYYYGGTTHSHAETSKQNALFLIESSEGLDEYDPDTLLEMKKAYEEGRYDDVADLAYLEDCNRRPPPQPPERRVNNKTTLHRKAPTSAWSRISELMAEVVEEDEKKETPIKCCVEAVRCLSRDLTYNNRTAAKESIRKAIECLENETEL